MPNLSHLELHSSVEFVSVIREHCVKVLKISNPDNYRSSFTANNFEILSSFLKTCNDIKELTLSSFNTYSVNFNLSINDFKFNLVSLTVENSLISNLQQFLLTQKSSLRNLTINCPNRNVELLKVIFNDLELIQLEMSTAIMPDVFPFINKNTTIKKLIIREDKSDHYNAEMNVERRNMNARAATHRLRHINQEEFPVEDFQQLFEPPNLNHLHHHLSYQSVRPIEGVWNNFSTSNNISTPYTKVRKIISICSAVEDFCNFDLDFSADSLLTQIHLSMTNLKILKLSNVPNFIPSDVHFKKLQCLDIGSINYEVEFVNLATLISQCVDLKIIKVRKLNTKSDPTRNISTIIENAHNLKEIHMRCLPSNMENSIKRLFEDENMKHIKFYCDFDDTSID